MASADEQIQFLTRFQRLLNEGSFVSTYKYALLMALADLSVELGGENDEALVIETNQIAEKFVIYYWWQSAPYFGSERVCSERFRNMLSGIYFRQIKPVFFGNPTSTTFWHFQIDETVMFATILMI